MSNLLANLQMLIERQVSGDNAARSEISRLNELVCGAHVYRDSDLSSQQVRAIELLLNEWSGMFSFQPGRIDGLPPIANLLALIRRKDNVELMDLYESPDWKIIVALRGPVETVQICRCAICREKYARMGVSGFLEILDFHCNDCGAVIFKSAYESDEVVRCPCGSLARVGCPSCSSNEHKVIEEISPYEYFSDHIFHRYDAR